MCRHILNRKSPPSTVTNLSGSMHGTALVAAVYLRRLLSKELTQNILHMVWPLMCFTSKRARIRTETQIRIQNKYNAMPLLRAVLPPWCFQRCYGCAAHYTINFLWTSNKHIKAMTRALCGNKFVYMTTPNCEYVSFFQVTRPKKVILLASLH